MGRLKMVTSDDCQDCFSVVARAGETNRVPLLIGVEWPFDGLIVFITEPYYHPSTNECDNVSTNDYGVIGGTNGTSSAGN